MPTNPQIQEKAIKICHAVVGIAIFQTQDALLVGCLFSCGRVTNFSSSRPVLPLKKN